MRGFLIGVGQCASLIPGTSRSMATIVTGQLVGLTTATAAEFSFLLALPTLGAATLYEAYKSRHDLLTLGPAPVAVGLVTSFLVAWAVIAVFISYLKRRGPAAVRRVPHHPRRAGALARSLTAPATASSSALRRSGLSTTASAPAASTRTRVAAARELTTMTGSAASSGVRRTRATSSQPSRRGISRSVTSAWKGRSCSSSQASQPSATASVA